MNEEPKIPEEVEASEDPIEMSPEEIKELGKVSFAWKWLITCGVLFVILIVLAILISQLRTGEVWPDSFYTG